MKRLLPLILLAGCGNGAEVKPDTEPTQPAQDVRPQSLDSACTGNRVPPTGYRQETAFASVTEANAAEVAKQRAMNALRDRVCQGYRCGEIESKLTLWNTEQDAERVCAMVVLKAEDIDAFLAAPRATFNKDLLTSAQEIASTLEGMKKKSVAIDTIRDHGVDGGPRAEWLIDQMQSALSKTNVSIKQLPRDWNGLGLPKGVDGILRGKVTHMHGRESMLEVTWNLELGDSLKSPSPVAFPELIGPVIQANSIFPELPDANRKVALRYNSRPGGALCAGQTTEMKLSVAEPLHVRVVNLYGADKGLVIWSSNGVMKPGKEVSLGEFMAVSMPDSSAERFLVVASKTPEDLGELVTTPVPCQIPTKAAADFGRGEGIKEGAKRFTTSSGFRVMTGSECSQYTPPDSVTIEGLPTCW